MVRNDLVARGVCDRRILAALASIPRHEFVSPAHVHRAYQDRALPSDHGQTISQPYVVARMTTEASLGRDSVVLEVGTGTGYHTAVLARLAKHVYTIERLRPLAEGAQQRLKQLGIDNVTFRVGDGALGWPETAPFDAIVIAAAVPHPPPILIEQLAIGGRMVVPVGTLDQQELMVVEPTSRPASPRRAGAVRFVPLISPHAFRASSGLLDIL